ncbi:hypothetical protein C8F01DRAFT_1167653 [Mycena amicta]|nr:hypothetical protein C8F01DRAFT_1167653 [Mycena amicta]
MPDLPTELLLQITSHLPRWEFYSLAVVSHIFLFIARSRLFADLSCTPGWTIVNASSGTALERQITRLAFLSSIDIASHVRIFRVTLRPVNMAESRLAISVSHAIASFSNLRELGWTATSGCLLDACSLSLHALPRLRKLRIASGELVADAASQSTPSHLLKIERFSFVDIPPLSSTGPSPLTLIDPNTLTHLYLSSYRRKPTLTHTLLHVCQGQSSFHALRTLSIGVQTASISQLYACVAPFPDLSRLLLHVDDVFPDPEDNSDLVLVPTPHWTLEHYKGPGALLSLLSISAPERVELTD